MGLLAHARIAMWNGGSLWLIDAIAPGDHAHTEPHAHHAIQITFSLGGRMRFRSNDLTVAGAAVAVSPDATHIFEAAGAHAHLFVDPESRDGRTIARKHLQQGPLGPMPPEPLQPFVGPLLEELKSDQRDDPRLIELGRSIIDRLVDGTVGDAPDLRVRKLMAAAAAQLDRTISLSDFAGVGGISASRLRHLFVEQTGLPFRTYLLWLRLSRALEHVAAGTPLTRAAHEAGFADSAHFSRTFKRMFGISPAALNVS